MQIYRSDAIIELSAEEISYLLGESTPPPELLAVKVRDRKGEFTVNYKTFRELVEQRAQELSYETDRTVLICDDGDGDTVARYNERGLVFEDAEAA